MQIPESTNFYTIFSVLFSNVPHWLQLWRIQSEIQRNTFQSKSWGKFEFEVRILIFPCNEFELKKEILIETNQSSMQIPSWLDTNFFVNPTKESLNNLNLRNFWNWFRIYWEEGKKYEFSLDLSSSKFELSYRLRRFETDWDAFFSKLHSSNLLQL